MYEDQVLRISLIESREKTTEERERMFSSASIDSMVDLSNHTMVSSRVYPENDSKSFVIITKMMAPGNVKAQTNKYNFRAGSAKERNAWVAQINKYTQNLDLKELDIVTEDEK